MALLTGTPVKQNSTAALTVTPPTVGAAGSSLVIVGFTPKTLTFSSITSGWTQVRIDHPVADSGCVVFYKNGANSSSMSFTPSANMQSQGVGYANDAELLQAAPTLAAQLYADWGTTNTESKTPTKPTSTLGSAYTYSRYPRKSTSPDMTLQLQTTLSGGEYEPNISLYSKALTTVSPSGTQRIWPYGFYDSAPGSATAGGSEQSYVATWLWEVAAAALAGDLAAASVLTANLRTSVLLAANAAAVASITGNLFVPPDDLGADVWAVAQITAALSASSSLIAALAGDATLAGDLTIDPGVPPAPDPVAPTGFVPGAGVRIQIAGRMPERNERNERNERSERNERTPTPAPAPQATPNPLGALAPPMLLDSAMPAMLDPAFAQAQMQGAAQIERQRVIAQQNAMVDQAAQRAFTQQQQALIQRIAAIKLPQPRQTTRMALQAKLAELKAANENRPKPSPTQRVVHDYDEQGRIVASRLVDR